MIVKHCVNLYTKIGKDDDVKNLANYSNDVVTLFKTISGTLLLLISLKNESGR